MSVILYEDETFLRIATPLKLKGRDLAGFWGYPKNWDRWDGMDKTLEKFGNCLRNANIDASNERYSENKPFQVLDYSRGVSPYSGFALIKSMKGVFYNSIESEKFNKTKDRLRDVIYFLMSQVIDAMPEYERVDTW